MQNVADKSPVAIVVVISKKVTEVTEVEIGRNLSPVLIDQDVQRCTASYVIQGVVVPEHPST